MSSLPTGTCGRWTRNCKKHPYYLAQRPPKDCQECLDLYREVNKGLWKTDKNGKNVRCEDWVI